jgi:predicted dehydrogenase
VPNEFWKLAGSTRKAGEGDPAVVWRYDQEVEFITAIQQNRDPVPSFADGVRCQAVIDAVVQSTTERRWIDL